MMKFRMVDSIIDWRPRKSISGIKTVSFEEYLLKEPFGGDPCLPESLLMESLFQLGNWLIMLSSDFSQMGLIVRAGKVRFHDHLRPGETLLMEISVRMYRSDGVLFDGRGLSEGREVTSGESCLATPVTLSDYYDPDDLRVLYGEIYRGEDDTAQ